MVIAKILSYKSPQRYAVRQTLIAAYKELHRLDPDLELKIIEITTLEKIERYTNVLPYPSLVLNEKLVCIGRFPKKDEVISMIMRALDREIVRMASK